MAVSSFVNVSLGRTAHLRCETFNVPNVSVRFVFHNGLHHSPIKALSDISHCWWSGVLDPPQRRIGPEPAHRERPCLHTGETQYESSAKASMKPLEKFWFSPRRNYTWKIPLTICFNSSKDFWLFLLIAEGCWQWNWENWQRWHWRVICGSQWGAASKHTSNLTSKDRLCQYMDIWADLDQQYPDQISTGEMIILEVIRKLSPEQVQLSFFDCWKDATVDEEKKLLGVDVDCCKNIWCCDLEFHSFCSHLQLHQQRMQCWNDRNQIPIWLFEVLEANTEIPLCVWGFNLTYPLKCCIYLLLYLFLGSILLENLQ